MLQSLRDDDKTRSAAANLTCGANASMAPARVPCFVNDLPACILVAVRDTVSRHTQSRIEPHRVVVEVERIPRGARFSVAVFETQAFEDRAPAREVGADVSTLDEAPRINGARTCE
jgi:hypothetical protein